MRIVKVENNSDLMRFIKFPWKIYSGNKNWVPNLIPEYKFILTKNPFWEHAKQALFLAVDDRNKIAGRVAGIIDYNYINFHQEPVGFFGFFESINDREVARQLLEAVMDFHRRNNLKITRGPTNPSTNDECGFLANDFDNPPRLMMPYNPPYYLNLLQDIGFNKVKELYAYDMDVSVGPINRLEKLAEKTLARLKEKVVIRPLNPKRFEAEIKIALKIYNAAWEKNWGFVPWTEKEFVTIATRMKDLFVPELTLLAEIGNEPVGMLIAVPDYNFVMQKMNGRLWPIGIFKFLYYKNKIQNLRLMIMGVIKEYRQRGIEGLMYLNALKTAMQQGYKRCEFSWILDDNIMTQRAAEMMGGKLYRRYFIYEKTI